MPEPTRGAADGPPHRVAAMVLDAAHGRYPAPDAGWHREPPWRPRLEAIVAFTAHAVVCLEPDIDDAVLQTLGVNGLGGAHAPRVLTELAGPDGWVSSLDLVMVRRPGGAPPAVDVPPLVPRPDLEAQPRVAYAARLRDDLLVYGYPEPDRTAVAIVGRGFAGLRELSYELEPDHRGRGEGAALVAAALAALESPTPLVACVAPGNVASLRVLLGCGFVPVASVQLLRRAPGYVPSAAG